MVGSDNDNAIRLAIAGLMIVAVIGALSFSWWAIFHDQAEFLEAVRKLAERA